MVNTSWSPASVNSTGFTNEVTSSLYEDGTDTYDGDDLVSTAVDLHYDGHEATPPHSTNFTPTTTNSTSWTPA